MTRARQRKVLRSFANNPTHEKCHKCQRCATCGAFHPCKRFPEAFNLCVRHRDARGYVK